MPGAGGPGVTSARGSASRAAEPACRKQWEPGGLREAAPAHGWEAHQGSQLQHGHWGNHCPSCTGQGRRALCGDVPLSSKGTHAPQWQQREGAQGARPGPVTFNSRLEE